MGGQRGGGDGGGCEGAAGDGAGGDDHGVGGGVARGADVDEAHCWGGWAGLRCLRVLEGGGCFEMVDLGRFFSRSVWVGG